MGEMTFYEMTIGEVKKFIEVIAERYNYDALLQEVTEEMEWLRELVKETPDRILRRKLGELARQKSVLERLVRVYDAIIVAKLNQLDLYEPKTRIDRKAKRIAREAATLMRMKKRIKEVRFV